ncbi:hypothetical protein ES705_37103 [subsurface metagenome]
MKRILFLIIILFLVSGIALGYELGAGEGTGYPAVIDTDTSVEVDYPDPLATTARAAVPNDTNAAVIAIETELGISPSGAYDTVKARLDAGDGLYYLKTEIDTKFAELKFIDLADTPAVYDNGKYAKSTADGIIWDTPAGGASTFTGLTDTPANYTGSSLKFVRVNVGETALEFAEEADPTVDTDAEIKAILVDEVIKTGAFTAGKIAKINNATGIIEEGTNTDTDVADAVTKKHSQNTDTDLDATFEATFVKKIDTINVLSDITSPGANIEDAVTKKHTQNNDTALGTLTADVNMGNHKLTGLSAPSASGQSVRTTAGIITEAFLEEAVQKKHTQNTDTSLDMVNALINNYDYSGLEDVQPVGETVTIGNLLYFDWTDKEWKKSDADLAANMPGLRMALEDKTDGQDCKMLVMGYIRVDNWNFAGPMVYASATTGNVTSVAPSVAGQQLQRVGVAKSADILFFDPSIDVGEIKP